MSVALCLCNILNSPSLATVGSKELFDEPVFFSLPYTFRKGPNMVQLTRNDVYTLKTLLPVNTDPPASKRPVRYSVNHGVSAHNPIEQRPDNCVAMEEWQDAHHPSCLLFHEIDLNKFTNARNEEQLRIVGSGFYRSVWMVHEYDGMPIALKALRYRSPREEETNLELLQKKSYQVDFNPQTIEQQHIDALVMEQLSASPYIADIYGYCSTSALVEYANGGNLLHSYEKTATKTERLNMAYNVAAAVADTHNYNQDGHATIAHTDLNPKQFLLINGTYKLNGFNRAKLLSWNNKTNKPCPIESGISWRAVSFTIVCLFPCLVCLCSPLIIYS